MLNYDLNDYNRTKELYEKYIILDDKHVNTHNNWGCLLKVHFNEYDRAAELYGNCIILDDKHV